ncbi:MAG: efflux RND transporter periplasmic adaptor subunit [Gammaproteobacteria bacterium]|nr:efflux RND transporter periplasmic adaptor subunit [Gammaproteobacteria bacterium]
MTLRIDPSSLPAIRRPRCARAALMLLALMLAGCPESGNPPAAGTVAASASLETAAVAVATVPRETFFDGVVEALNQSTVSAQTSGRVLELPVDVGDHVEKGALIVRFTDTEQKARAAAAESELGEANARLAEAQLGFDRIREIHAKKLVARAQFDRARADLDAARAKARAAQAALDEVREGLANTVIRAPYAGIVVARHVQIGETVGVGTPLLTGVSLEHLRVHVDVPHQHIGELRKHRQARVLLPDDGSIAIEELRISPNADPETHTFRVLATVPQGDYGVYPGMLLKVAFVTGTEERLLLPAAALVRRGEIDAAYVVGEDGRVGFRYLRVGTPAADGRVPVLAGLAAGERVATDPLAAAVAYKAQGAPAGESGE